MNPVQKRGMNPPLILVSLIMLLISCKNENKDQQFTYSEEFTTGDELDLSDENSISNEDESIYKIYGMPSTEGVMTITEYIDQMNLLITNTESYKLITIPNTKEKVLFLQYFSGGAHCCSVIEAYTYNKRFEAFEYKDEYSFDGDRVELIYPFNANYRIEYFYCSYAHGGSIECPKSKYDRRLHFEDDKFFFKSTGIYEEMKTCLINYLQQTEISELRLPNKENGKYFIFDNGERETVLNFMLEMYTIEANLLKLERIYNTYFTNVSDKEQLWLEIAEILSKKQNISPVEQVMSTILKNRIEKSDEISAHQTSNDFNNETFDDVILNVSSSSLSCDELLQLVQNDGSRLEYLDQSDMNSSALDYVALYEYGGVYYVVIEFTSSSQEYIYCDISRNYWDAFVENEDNSFGSGYHNYIRPYTSCNCGR